MKPVISTGLEMHTCSSPVAANSSDIKAGDTAKTIGDSELKGLHEMPI